MNTGHRVIEDHLKQIDNTWRWLRLLQQTGTVGIALSLFFLLLALGITAGWPADVSLAKALVGVAVTIAFIVWCGLLLGILGKTLDRRWLAQMVERGRPGMFDRVNTLVALEKESSRPWVRPFYLRIVQQAGELLVKKPPAPTVSARRPVLHLLVLLAVLLATMKVYDKLSPWDRLHALARHQQAAGRPEPAEPSLDLPPLENAVEHRLPWGEVRVTVPARDLEVTKVDVVPLQIEAAANEPLQQVGWISAVNSLDEQPHDLPAPADPRYAIYQPTLYLDEYKLSDWDVLTYYARASTRTSHVFASDVHFLQVRPFREDILKMPGGETGRAMECINQLSTLIRQQQHLIRQTHRHIHAPAQDPKLQEQDRNKLADAETDLSRSVEHLYAKMTSDLENKPIGDALDHLAKAEQWLARAGASLRDSLMDDAQTQERGALADLVAARKAFQKAVSDDPKSFADFDAEESPPLAGAQDKLEQIAEFRDEDKAAREFLDQLGQKQAALANRAAAARPAGYPKMADDQEQIRQSLEQFVQQHPRPFNPVQPETERTRQSLQSAAQLLEKKHAQAKSRVQDAAQDLNNLARAMREKSFDRQLADAYKLKQMLDQQIEKFGQCQNPGPGGGPSDAETKQAAADTRRALGQLKNIAEQPPTREAFGPALRESLNEVNMLTLHWPLSELEQAPAAEAKQRAAGHVKEGLMKVSKAFEASQPQAWQAAQQKAQPEEPEAGLARGLARLESLIKQLEENRPTSPEDLAKQGQEALYSLQNAWRELGNGNRRGTRALVQLAEALQPDNDPPEVEILRQLKEDLQLSSAEVVHQTDGKPAGPEVTALDPSRLPAAYRGRIEKYFQRLSEK